MNLPQYKKYKFIQKLLKYKKNNEVIMFYKLKLI